jgi:diguanylate cyclase (GGDEF)-like protein
MDRPRDSEQRSERGQRDREVASLALAFLFGAGATLGLLTLLLPHGSAVDPVGIAAVCAAAYAVAALTIALRPLAWPLLHAVLAIGTLMITAVVEFSDILVGGFGFFYLWVAVFAAYFFTRLGAAVQGALVAACYAGLIVADGTGDEWGFGWLLTIGALAVVAVLVRALRERVDRLVEQLSLAASTDDLSGLLNRRGFNQRLGEELRRATRSGQGLALVVGDLDRFKEINDRFGHPAGDEALRRVGAMLRECARESDTVARLGGEEFALVLPYTEPPGALTMAERIRKLIRDEFAAEGLTISFGIAAYPDDGDTQDMLMRAADNALYSAKTLGRDRIEAPPGASGAGD